MRRRVSVTGASYPGPFAAWVSKNFFSAVGCPCTALRENVTTPDLFLGSVGFVCVCVCVSLS